MARRASCVRVGCLGPRARWSGSAARCRVRPGRPMRRGRPGTGLARARHTAGVGCTVAAPGKIERPAADKVKTGRRQRLDDPHRSWLTSLDLGSETSGDTAGAPRGDRRDRDPPRRAGADDQRTDPGLAVGLRLLVDPMLDPAGARPAIANTINDLRNARRAPVRPRCGRRCGAGYASARGPLRWRCGRAPAPRRAHLLPAGG